MKKSSLSLMAPLLLLIAVQSMADVPVSTNYEGIYETDDGKVEIVGPSFKEGEGNYYVSTSSNFDGLCRLYGFRKYVPRSHHANHTSHKATALIGEDGNFQRIIKWDGYYNNLAVESFMCEASNRVSFSRRYDKSPVTNDDGSVTIIGPSFGYGVGRERRISSSSNSNGVCKLYGYGNYVTATYSVAKSDMVVINDDSKFSTYQMVDSYYAYNHINTVTCKSESIAPLSPKPKHQRKRDVNYL